MRSTRNDLSVAVPVDLCERVATAGDADETSRVAGLEHLVCRVARDLRTTRRIYQHTRILLK